MTYKETIKFLYNSLPNYHIHGEKAYKANLDNINKFDILLKHPHKTYKSIHIGGTNGKGTTAHGISKILNDNNIITGLYTSPHIKTFRERIIVSEKKITKKYVVSFIKNHLEIINEIKPSFFEITTMMALNYFKFKKVDLAIIEVGLGGRLDSTNIINPLLSIITNVSLDHQNILGNEIINIAKEKSGIIKNESLFIKGEKQPNIDHIFEKSCVQLKTKFIKAYNEVKIKTLSKEINQRKIEINFNKVKTTMTIRQPTKYFLKNIPSILTSSKIILEYYNKNINEKSFLGLQNLNNNSKILGRWQIHSIDPIIISDACHNIDAFKNVLNDIKSYNFKSIYFIIGGVENKSWNNIINLLPTKIKYIISEPTNERSISSKVLSKFFNQRNLNYIVINDVNKAIEHCKKLVKEKNDLIFIGGSFFLISDIHEK